MLIRILGESNSAIALIAPGWNCCPSTGATLDATAVMGVTSIPPPTDSEGTGPTALALPTGVVANREIPGSGIAAIP